MFPDKAKEGQEYSKYSSRAKYSRPSKTDFKNQSVDLLSLLSDILKTTFTSASN